MYTNNFPTVDDTNGNEIWGRYILPAKSEEMSKLFSDLPEAISNTELVAEMCELNIDFNPNQTPQYKLPSN
ncbi:MAG: hypothetical protein CM1200mP38_6290 [Dehalococcoidia bacterium]|nr:MAG: hypothetical protein CM1200mP38_6290 [Dehalococcoidia bacterium]